jgi:hypothetical protein
MTQLSFNTRCLNRDVSHFVDVLVQYNKQISHRLSELKRKPTEVPTNGISISLCNFESECTQRKNVIHADNVNY